MWLTVAGGLLTRDIYQLKGQLPGKDPPPDADVCPDVVLGPPATLIEAPTVFAGFGHPRHLSTVPQLVSLNCGNAPRRAARDDAVGFLLNKKYPALRVAGDILVPTMSTWSATAPLAAHCESVRLWLSPINSKKLQFVVFR